MRKHRFRYPLVVWPWYLRWTFGTALFAFLVIVGVIGAFWQAGRAAWQAYHESEAWEMIATCFCGWILGDLKDK